MAKKKDKAAWQLVAAVLGVEYLETLEEDNWLDVAQQTPDIFGPGRYEIAFKEKDGVGDTVIFQSFVYDSVRGKWWSENCIDSEPVEFDTYAEMLAHYNTLEDAIIDNGFQFVDVPDQP